MGNIFCVNKKKYNISKYNQTPKTVKDLELNPAVYKNDLNWRRRMRENVGLVRRYGFLKIDKRFFIPLQILYRMEREMIETKKHEEFTSELHLRRINDYGQHCLEMTKYMAIFVHESVFVKFSMELPYNKILQEDHVWDYNLRLGSNTYDVKMIWILKGFSDNRANSMSKNFDMITAFKFLQPCFLKYLAKPFNNPDVITQVNLVLDYHRQRKRQHNVDIFNIVDLISFKMAIDDNRFEYENCEFHKVVVRMLVELANTEMYVTRKIFNLNEYMQRKAIFLPTEEIVEYFAYHFQDYIDDLIIDFEKTINIQLSDDTEIDNILGLVDKDYDLDVTEIDPNGNFPEILYKLLIFTNNFIRLTFNLDCPYKWADDVISNPFSPIFGGLITINTKNTYHFVENFVNLLKRTCANQTKHLAMTINGFESIQPYILTGFYLRRLELCQIELNAKLVIMLNRSCSAEIEFIDCRLVDDPNERIDYLVHRKINDKNTVKLLDQLDRASVIQLRHEEHVIGTVWKYIFYTMIEYNSTKFRFTNDIRLGSLRLKDTYIVLNYDSTQLEMCADDDRMAVEISKLFYGETHIDRNEFDFYQ